MINAPKSHPAKIRPVAFLILKIELHLSDPDGVSFLGPFFPERIINSHPLQGVCEAADRFIGTGNWSF